MDAGWLPIECQMTRSMGSRVLQDAGAAVFRELWKAQCTGHLIRETMFILQ